MKSEVKNSSELRVSPIIVGEVKNSSDLRVRSKSLIRQKKKKIHNVANGGSYIRLTRKAKGFDFGENSKVKLDLSGRIGSNVREALSSASWPAAADKASVVE